MRSVVLYGSFARGEANEDSDVDVLAIVDGLTNVEAWEAAGDAAPIVLETGFALSPVLLSTERMEELRAEERLFVRTIDAEGIPL